MRHSSVYRGDEVITALSLMQVVLGHEPVHMVIEMADLLLFGMVGAFVVLCCVCVCVCVVCVCVRVCVCVCV